LLGVNIADLFLPFMERGCKVESLYRVSNLPS
jgi:hypothetical protein